MRLKTLHPFLMRTATTLTVLMLIMMAFSTEAKAQTIVSSWGDLKSAAEAATTTTPKNIKLVGNITRNASEEIEVTGTVTLDLNGHTIDGGGDSYLRTCIFHVDYNGELTITDLTDKKGGQIFGADAANINIGGIYNADAPYKPGKVTLAAGTIGGPNIGVALAVGGSFTMTGGTINTGSESGTGVDLDESSRFTMSGGSITGNGIGVNIQSNNDPASMTVSGNVNISGNTTGDVSLAYVSGAFTPIHIGGNLSANARIGVWTSMDASAVRGNTFTSGLSGKGSASNFFISNSRRNELGILPNGNELCFAIVDNNNSSGALQILVDYEGGEYAVLDCNYTGNVPVSIAENKYVNRVLVYRNFNISGANAYSTLMLPFAVETSKLTGVSAIYSFGGIGVDEDGNKAVIANIVWNETKAHFTLPAGTPYLVKMNSTTLGVNDDVTITSLTNDPYVEKDNWRLYGTRSYIQWLSNSETASEIGSVYGFAAGSGDGVSVGDFVKVESGASIKPFRAYLKHITNTTRGMTRGDDDEELPERMRVIVRDSSSETGILEVRSEKPDEAWYALDGRQLNGKPSLKGVYINGGRKVVIK